jgi:predicted RNase H-like HicB family nuclease
LANNSFQYYLDLPWTFTVETEITKEEGKIYIVRVNELLGVVTDAPTIESAMESIKEAMLLAFEMYRESGEEIPHSFNDAATKPQ